MSCSHRAITGRVSAREIAVASQNGHVAHEESRLQLSLLVEGVVSERGWVGMIGRRGRSP